MVRIETTTKGVGVITSRLTTVGITYTVTVWIILNVGTNLSGTTTDVSVRVTT